MDSSSTFMGAATSVDRVGKRSMIQVKTCGKQARDTSRGEALFGVVSDGGLPSTAEHGL
jgi:hypothetical protein